MRFFELGRIRFALRINDDVDLLRPEEYFMRIANEKLPLRLYHKVGAVLFSHEYFSRDVPVFGLFHDFTREKDGRAECETVDDQLWQRLQRSLTVEDCREAKSHDVAPWDIPIYKPLPFVEPAFSNNQCSAACSLSPAPPMPDAFLPPPLAPDDCLEVEAPKAPAAAPSVAPRVERAGVDLSEGPKGGTLPDDYEIANGVTVGHIRALFDQSRERYSPELAAAVFAWASFEKDPAVAAGWTVKEEIKNGRLPDWEGPPLSTEAKKRIAIVVNWDKTPAKH